MTRPALVDDTGSTLPLIIFYTVFSLILVLIVVSVTSLYLERKRLFTLADGAALVGAEAFEFSVAQPTATGIGAGLDAISVASAVEGYLETAPAEGFTELRLEAAGTADGRSATVTLSTQWDPPLVSFLVPEGFRIDVTVTARSVFG